MPVRAKHLMLVLDPHLPSLLRCFAASARQARIVLLVLPPSGRQSGAPHRAATLGPRQLRCRKVALDPHLRRHEAGIQDPAFQVGPAMRP